MGALKKQNLSMSNAEPTAVPQDHEQVFSSKTTTIAARKTVTCKCLKWRHDLENDPRCGRALNKRLQNLLFTVFVQQRPFSVKCAL